jgi:hypothetical protein
MIARAGDDLGIADGRDEKACSGFHTAVSFFGGENGARAHDNTRARGEGTDEVYGARDREGELDDAKAASDSGFHGGLCSVELAGAQDSVGFLLAKELSEFFRLHRPTIGRSAGRTSGKQAGVRAGTVWSPLIG